MQIRSPGLGIGFDVDLYAHYAERWCVGGVPYVDFVPEYPPGALPVFVLPWLFAGKAFYAQAFAAEMAAFDLAGLVLTLRFTREQTPSARVFASAAAAYIALTALLFPVAYARFDLVPGVLVLAALCQLSRHRGVSAGVLLGLAAAVKLWPLALLPLWFFAQLRRGELRPALTLGLSFVLGMFTNVGPFMFRAGTSVFLFLQGHQARSIQIESTWATFILTCRALGLSRARTVSNYGAVHLVGTLAKVCSKLSLPMLLFCLLLPQRAAFRGARRNQHAPLGSALWLATSATTIGFIVGGKVFSPQYMLWLLPVLVPSLVVAASFSVRTAWFAAVAALLASVLTTAGFPFLQGALMDAQDDRHSLAIACVGVRNLALVGLYVLYVHTLLKGRPEASQAAPMFADRTSRGVDGPCASGSTS